MQLTAASAHEVRAIVARGRELLVHAVRSGLDRGLLRRADDGLFATTVGSEELDRLLAPSGAAPIQSAPPSTAPTLPRLAKLLVQIEARESAVDLLVLLLAPELD